MPKLTFTHVTDLGSTHSIDFDLSEAQVEAIAGAKFPPVPTPEAIGLYQAAVGKRDVLLISDVRLALATLLATVAEQ